MFLVSTKLDTAQALGFCRFSRLCRWLSVPSSRSLGNELKKLTVSYGFIPACCCSVNELHQTATLKAAKNNTNSGCIRSLRAFKFVWPSDICALAVSGCRTKNHSLGVRI
eukprot:4702738-Amphidinium_carterae.1